MSGGISLPYLLLITVELGSESAPSLVFKDGDWKVPDVAFMLNDVYLGAFVIDDLTLAFAETTDGVSFSATLKLWFPAGMVVGGEIEFDGEGRLETIGVSFSGGMLALGDSGIFLTGFSAEVQNLDHPENLIVSGSLTAVFGDQFTLGGFKVTPIKATGSFTVDKDEFVAGLAVYVAAYTPPTGAPIGLLGEGTGTITLDWAGHDYSLAVHLDWYDDLFSVDAIIDLSGTGDIPNLFVKAKADVNVPDGIPFIGGKTIGGIDFALNYIDGDPSQSFVAAWVEIDLIVHKFDIGFKVDFNKHVSVIGNKQVDAINNGSDNTQPQIYNYYSQFVVPEGATHATLGVSWANVYNFATQSISVLPPNQSTPISMQDFSAANGISWAFYDLQNGLAAIHIVGSSTDPDQPLPAGVYQLILTSVDLPVFGVTFDGLFGYTAPRSPWARFRPTRRGPFAIPITATVDATFAGVATITLFYDNDDSGYDGTPIPGFVELPYSRQHGARVGPEPAAPRRALHLREDQRRDEHARLLGLLERLPALSASLRHRLRSRASGHRPLGRDGLSSTPTATACSTPPATPTRRPPRPGTTASPRPSCPSTRRFASGW